MRSIYTFFCIVLLAVVSPAYGQFGTLGQVNDPVSWEEKFDKKQAIELGEEISLNFEAVVEPGFWVYSAIPSEGNPGAATSFHWDDSALGVETTGDLGEEGKGKKYFDDVFETDMVKYEDKVLFKQKVKVSAETPQLDGYLRYQVCNEEMCIPKEYTFSFTPNVVAKKKTAVKTELPPPNPEPKNEEPQQSEEPEEPQNTQLADNVPSVMPEPPTSNLLEEPQPETVQEVAELVEEPVTTQRGGSLWKLMLEGFLFGFASILTPCIFPMIPLTVSYFTKRKENKASGVRDAVFLWSVHCCHLYRACLGIVRHFWTRYHAARGHTPRL